MTRQALSTAAIVAGAMLTITACDAISILLPQGNVTIRLVNASSFAVDGVLYYGDDQQLPDLLLTELGTEVTFNITAGQTRTLVLPCDDVQVVIIENANLQVLVGLGPDANTDGLRDGSDFSCGDTIVYTFSHSEVILDFDIDTDVQ